MPSDSNPAPALPKLLNGAGGFGFGIS